MRAVPQHLDAGDLAAALGQHWGIETRILEYFPHGAGAYHWVASDGAGQRWFVTVDDLGTKPWLGDDPDTTFAGLDACYRAATTLRDRSGLEFVVAPLSTHDGPATVRLDERHSMAVSPFVNGTAGTWGTPVTADERNELLGLLARLHTTPAPTDIPRRPLAVPARGDLESALATLDRPWHTGPHSQPARRALQEHETEVSQALERFDRLAAELATQDAPLVVTHGEPHPGNLLRTGQGLLLVDWDTVALARPERDLWMFASAGAGAGDPRALEAYRLAWALSDLASYTATLRAPHGEDADTERALRAIESILAGDEPAPYGHERPEPYGDHPRGRETHP